MYEAAVLRSGYDLKDAPAFAQRIERILRTALEVDHGLGISPEFEPVEDDDDEDDDKVCADNIWLWLLCLCLTYSMSWRSRGRFCNR
jgi:hypothetical protein